MYNYILVLTVIVSPAQLSVGVNSRVEFECAAIGNLIETIEWARDVGQITRVRHQYKQVYVCSFMIT